MFGMKTVNVVPLGCQLLSLQLILLGSAGATPAADSELTTQMARIDRLEPTVAETQRAARRRAGLGEDRIGSIVRRSRWSGLLPDVTLRATTGSAIDEDLSRASSGTEKLSTSVDSDRGYEARATFHLSRLLYHPIELRAEAQSVRRQQDRIDLDRLVARAYFLRREAQLRRLEAGANDVAAQLAVARTTADLDALTGGWFARELSAQ